MRRFRFGAEDPALLAGLLICAVGGVLGTAAHAQVTSAITPDGTLGTSVTQPAPGFFNIDGGTILGGTNQFHSFGQFTVGTGDRANFDGPASIQNVLSRVTGGSLSNIDGTVSSSIADANVFLINPAGVIFGPNSTLDVQGSFHATTADYIGLSDGTRFNAIPSAADATLTSAAPAAFGFLNAPPAPIEVTTSNLLRVPDGETLSFVGGNLDLGVPDGSAPAYVMAPGGTINLASVASTGEATFASPINTDAFSALGDINITGGSIVDAKEVFIRSGKFVIDESVILPGFSSLTGFSELPGFSSLLGFGPPPDGGEVNVKVRNDVVISGTGPELFTEAPAGILTFSGRNDIRLVTGPAKVPDITIEANSVTLSGFATVQAARIGPGDPPNVLASADSIKVENGAAFALFNFFEGPGGTLTLNAREVDLSGGGIAGGAAGATGLLAQGLFHPSYFVISIDPALSFSDSGTINVNASETLKVTGGAQITTDSLSFGRGEDVTIHAGNMFLSDNGAISSQSLFAGDSGNVTLQAAGSGRIEIANGFVVAATTFGTGQSGRVDIGATEAVSISGVASGIGSQTVPPPQAALDGFAIRIFGFTLPDATFGDLAGALGLDPESADLFDVLGALNAFGLTAIPEPLVPGDGGEITVNTPVLTVSGEDSAIDSSTAWDGNAGAVNLNVGSLTVSNGAQIRSRSGLTEIATGQLFVGTGNAGTINVDASEASTITVTGADSAISTSTLGSGDAGNITLRGPRIHIRDNGRVTSESTGAGLAGDIAVIASNEVFIDNGGSISTEALSSDGGNIFVKADKLIAVRNSEITTSVQEDVGAGGNIELDPPAIVLQNSQVIANAFGGPGGNINIVATQFIVDPLSVVDASSALGIDGVVDIDAPDTTVTGDLVPLTRSLLDASRLLRDRCGAARARGGSSSLVASGRGGVSVEPDGYLPSFAGGWLSTRVAAGDPNPPLGPTTLASAGSYLPSLWSQECP